MYLRPRLWACVVSGFCAAPFRHGLLSPRTAGLIMYPDLYLIRHGQTLWNREGRIQGRLDSPLTELGRTQARMMADLVRDIPAYRVSSPQGRALETAQILFGEHSFTTDARLAEIDTGAFTGQHINDLRRNYPDAFLGSRLSWYDHTPDGEHFADLRARVATFLTSLRGTTIVVTHGITLRMIRSIAMGQDGKSLDELPVEQGAIHLVRARQHEILHPTSY